MSYAQEHNVSVYLTEEQINKRVAEIGAQITERFKGESVYLVCILRGSIFFATELAKRIDLPTVIDFMTVSSYGAQTVSSGVIHVKQDLQGSIEGENVIIIEDIIDSGLTLSHLLGLLEGRHPASLKICVLLDKKERRKTEVKVDYCGFSIPDKFVVGYGLDCAGMWRHLKDIKYVIEE